jgi:chorismate mutase
VNVRAARGAICVPADDAASVHAATAKLLEAIVDRNAIGHDDLISILFTATEDLSSAFPAEAARRMGMGDIPLMCAREIPVVGSMPSVIRILLHFHTDLGLREVTHVYLDGAERLRDDLDAAF